MKISMQSKNSGFFFKNSGYVKRDCRKCVEWGVRKTVKFAEGNKNNPRTRVTDRMEITATEVTTGSLLI